MKKIMFNDKYGLTQAVLEGRKTQTRRMPSESIFQRCLSIAYCEKGFTTDCETRYAQLLLLNATYSVGEEVAVAQNYKDAGCDFYFHRGLAGWNNKMFVRAEEMPHRIKITNVRVERLQDISDADCFAEGAQEALKHLSNCEPNDLVRDIFSILIDKTCGKGTWDSNPWVFVYDFEFIK